MVIITRSYLMVYQLQVEGHQDHWQEQVEEHKRQEDDTGAKEESAQEQVSTQNLVERWDLIYLVSAAMVEEE